MTYSNQSRLQQSLWKLRSVKPILVHIEGNLFPSGPEWEPLGMVIILKRKQLPVVFFVLADAALFEASALGIQLVCCNRDILGR